MNDREQWLKRQWRALDAQQRRRVRGRVGLRGLRRSNPALSALINDHLRYIQLRVLRRAHATLLEEQSKLPESKRRKS